MTTDEERVPAEVEPRRGGPDDDRGVYGISVTAEMVGTGVQNLRLYERRGLLEPRRTAGGTRLYSRNDIRRLSRITELLAAGLNLVGVAMVLDLQDDLAEIRRRAGARRGRPDRHPDRPGPEPAGSGSS